MTGADVEDAAPLVPASPRASAVQPAGPARNRGLITTAVALLVGLAVFALVLEGSVITRASEQLNLRRPLWGHDGGDGDRHAEPQSDGGDDSWMWRTNVPGAELVHLSMLHAACLDHKDSVIPWTFGRPGADQESAAANKRRLVNEDDPKLLEKLRECPDVDIFIPGPLRGHGYCEDAIVYSKFLKSRLLPRWALEKSMFDAARGKNVTYMDLCPHTPLLFFNHYWDGVPELPAWPKRKPVYLMPNIEMYELDETHLWNVDVVLCKTLVCMDRISRWYKQEGNPRNTKVFYTRHTTSDVAHYARHVLGDRAIKPKDFANIRFLHAAGASSQKGTRQVVECWLSRPDFPPLDLVIKDSTYQWMFPVENPQIRGAKNIRLMNTQVAPVEFGKMVAEAAFFLCTSVMEGYGHYINQARASGGVVVTTDGPPMNELISSSDMGVFVHSTARKDGGQFLGGASTKAHALQGVEGLSASVSKETVCRAVEELVFRTEVWERESMATRAREAYHVDTAFFAQEMLRLQAFARRGRLELEREAQAEETTATGTNNKKSKSRRRVRDGSAAE